MTDEFHAEHCKVEGYFNFESVLLSQPSLLIQPDCVEVAQHIYYSTSSSHYGIIPFSVTPQQNSSISIDYDFEDIGSKWSTGSSIRTEKLKLSSRKILNFVHDYVFGCLVPQTDFKISSKIRGSSSDPNSRLTPDYILAVDGGYIVVEFTTSKGVLQNAYSEKISKYTHPLKSVVSTCNNDQPLDSKIGIKYYVIAVGKNGIVTNLELPELIREELSYRYCVATAINSDLIRRGFKSETIVEDDNLNVKRMKQFFSVFNSDERFENEREDEWSDSNYIKMMDPPDSSKLKDFEKKIIQKSYLEATENLKINPVPISDRDPTILRKRENECLKQHHVFEEEYLKTNEGNMRDDLKSMVQFPLLVPTLVNGDRSIGLQSIGSTLELLRSPHSEGRLWHEAIMDCHGNESNFLTDKGDDEILTEITGDLFDNLYPETIILNSYEKEVISKSFTAKKQNAQRNSYQRVSVSVDSEDRVDLAKVGIWGKRHKFEASVIQYREEKSRFFNIKETATFDLDDLLNDKDFLLDFFNPRLCLNDTLRCTNTLITQGWKAHGVNHIFDSMVRNLHEICKTPFFQYNKFISDIAVELSISLKQNCRSKQFIMKKLKDWDVWMLVKPTKSTSHIFYSLLGLTDDIQFCPLESTVFKQVMQSNKFWFTPFVSANISKLTNLCLCESRAFGLLSFWSHSFKVFPYEITSNHIIGHPVTSIGELRSKAYEMDVESSLSKMSSYFNSFKMTMLNVMISMIDKSEVEEEITKTRYIVMESMVSWPLVPNPAKMLKKTSLHFRSRFTLWLYRKHKEYTLYLARCPIRALANSQKEVLTLTGSHLIWDGFKNPYLNERIQDIQQVINLFYLGYIRNKDQYPENNTLSKLYKKILDIEDRFTSDVRGRIGREDKELFNDSRHEYNITALKAATDYCVSMRLKNDSNYLKDIEKNVATFMCDTDVEDCMTTLKASSPFGPEFYTRDSVTTKYKRIKVIEAILPYVKDDQVKLIDVLPNVYPLVFSDDCLHIDIFQKNQHGGLREIFVLNITNRILQYFVETISRLLCLGFEGETMTHPSHKKTLPESHHKRASALFREGYITMCTSADAAKWSQNQYSHKFAIILYRFLPTYMHKFLNRILRLWKNKKILINPKLLEIFDQNQDCKFYDPIIQNMYDGYHGTQEIRWIQKRSPYITVETGMMQGILHYTSSLFHSVVNDYLRALIVAKFQTISEKLSEKFDIKHTTPVVTMMQSSDDSCMLLSIAVTNDFEVHCHQLTACAMQMIKINFGSEVGIINSDKTSPNTKFVYEFNSDFEFGSSHYKPDIKHVFSANLISEEELLAARQEELSTLLTVYLESGGYSYIANFLQVGQAYLNYRLLGSSSTEFYKSYSLLIQYMPDPSSGFFLMDNLLCPGICGFKYNLWVMCRGQRLGFLYKSYLSEIERTHEEGEGKRCIEATQSGAFMQTTKLSYGNREKWMKLVDRMHLPRDWREYFDTHPNILYRKSVSTEEFFYRVAMKMHSPGVASSLSKGNCVSRTISASSYILKVRSLSNESSWLRMDKSFEEKLTLLETIIATMRTRGENMLSEEDLTKLFPFHLSYLDTYRILEGFSLDATFHSHSITYKRNITSLDMFESSHFAFEPPTIVIPYVWFGEEDDLIKRPRYSRDMIEMLFQGYKSVIPWLDKDPMVSLTKSPFSNHLEMKTWIEKIAGNSRTVRLLGAPISTRAGLSTLPALIIQNFSCGYKLVPRGSSCSQQPVHSSAGLRHNLLLVSTIPYLSNQDTLKMMEFIIGEFSCGIVQDTRGQRKRTNTLYILGKYLAGEPVMAVMDHVRKLRSGVVGGFSICQRIITYDDKSVGYSGYGEWVGTIEGISVRFTIENEGEVNYVQRIYMVNPDEISIIYHPLVKLFNELGLQINNKILRKIANETPVFLDCSGPSFNQGVPVSFAGNDSFKFQYQEGSRLELSWTGYSLRLSLFLPRIRKGCHRSWRQKESQAFETRITVMSYVPKETDLLSGDQAPVTRLASVENPDSCLMDLEKKWLRSESMNPTDALALMQKVQFSLDCQDGREKVHQTVWNQCSENLRAALAHKGIYRRSMHPPLSTKRAVTKIQDQVDESHKVMDFEVDLDFLDDFFVQLSNVETEIDNVESDSDDFADYDEAEKIMDIIRLDDDVARLRNSRVFTQHPLFSNYVASLFDRFSHKKIKKMFIDMIVEEEDRNHVAAVCLFNQVGKDQVEIKNITAPVITSGLWRF